jgi:hypothetical protein
MGLKRHKHTLVKHLGRRRNRLCYPSTRRIVAVYRERPFKYGRCETSGVQVLVKQPLRDHGEGAGKDKSTAQNKCSQHARTGGQRNDVRESIAYFYMAFDRIGSVCM